MQFIPKSRHQRIITVQIHREIIHDIIKGVSVITLQNKVQGINTTHTRVSRLQSMTSLEIFMPALA